MGIAAHGASRPKPRFGTTCAIVMGLDVSGYGLVRGLARAGVPVVALWRRADECGRFSRYCAALKVSPDEDEAWIRAITHLATQYEHPVLFPSNDRYADFLARHQETLAPLTRFHWVSRSHIETVIDKSRMGEAAARIGLAVPRTHRPQGQDIWAEAERFVYPCVVKPVTTCRVSLPGNEKTITCRTPEELVALYRRAPHLLGGTLWQEIIEGGDDAIYQGTVLCSAPGRIEAVACVRKLRQYVPGFGITSFGRTEWQLEVVEHAARLVAAVRWSGVASIEFKRSSTDGRFYFIEMNPRVPWYNVLFADAGQNLAYHTWCSLTGGPVLAGRQADGVTWLSLASDVASFWQRHATGTLSTRSWLGSLGEARSFSWFDRSDPLPALATALRQSALALRFVKREPIRLGIELQPAKPVA